MASCKRICLVILLFMLLTGCWDEREIGEYGYATAIGVDYQDGEYILYIQLLDFSNVAKQEIQKVSEDAAIFVGKSTGKSFYDAINNIYKTSQQPLHWGQIGSVIYSESVLQRDVDQIEQSMKRNGEFRYTPWIFATRDSIEDIFSISGFFHLSSIYTILYQPEDTYKAHSFIKPLRMYEFIANNHDPGRTVILPSIVIDNDAWMEAGINEELKKTLKVDGAFLMSQGEYQGYLSMEDLIGLRWHERKTGITPVELIKDGKHIGVVEIRNPKGRIELLSQGEKIKFKMIIKAKGTIADLQEELSQKEIIELVEKQIEANIKTTFEKGLEQEIDVFNLKSKLFRSGYSPEEIKTFQLSKDLLEQIQVDFHLESEGLFDGKR